MIKQLYSLKDVKSDFFGTPVPFHNDEDAKRGLSSIFNNPQSQAATYPQDFRLYKIGSLDDNSGTLTPIDPKFICELAILNPHPETNSDGTAK